MSNLEDSIGKPCQCPLCGQPNHCARAQPTSSAGPHCWCFSVRIAPETIGRLQHEGRATNCICPACAATAGAPDGQKSR